MQLIKGRTMNIKPQTAYHANTIQGIVGVL